MKKQKIANTDDTFLVSSNEYEDDACPVCKLMKRLEVEKREPTISEIYLAMHEAKKENK